MSVDRHSFSTFKKSKLKNRSKLSFDILFDMESDLSKIVFVL